MNIKFKYVFALGVLFLSITGAIFYISQKQKRVEFVSGNLPINAQENGPVVSNSVVSSDGKNTLVMKMAKQESQSVYTFFSNDSLIYTRVTTGKMSIPYNAWSIDDKMFFIKEEANNQVNFYVVPGDINVGQKFREKFPDFTLQDVTGWAANNLLVVNANDGKNDISYWFDISSQSFIRLSNRFN